MFIYFWDRERAWVGGGGGQRERETEDPKRALSWQQWAPCRARTHKLWDNDQSPNQMLNWLSRPGTPKVFQFIIFLSFIYLTNLYTHCGAQTHNPKIKSHMFHPWVSQALPLISFFEKEQKGGCLAGSVGRAWDLWSQELLEFKPHNGCTAYFKNKETQTNKKNRNIFVGPQTSSMIGKFAWNMPRFKGSRGMKLAVYFPSLLPSFPLPFISLRSLYQLCGERLREFIEKAGKLWYITR